MKKLCYLMVLLLCLSIVMAGESYDLTFDDAKTKAVVMVEGDEVRFEMLGGTHSVIVDKVSTSMLEFNIVPFMGDSTDVRSGYVTLDTVAKLDLDRDGVIDMNLALYSVNGDAEATVVFQSLADSTIGENVDSGVVDQEMPEWKSTVLKVIAVCVVILVVFYIFRGKKEEEDEDKLTPEEEKEVDDLLDKAEKEMSDE